MYWERNLLMEQTLQHDTEHDLNATTDTVNQTEMSTESSEKTYTQSDLDREVDRRLAKQQAKIAQQIEEVKAAGKVEGHDLATTSEKERLYEELSLKAQDLEKREEMLQKQSLTITVNQQLMDQGLPTNLTESLVALGNQEVIQTTIDTIAGAIQQGINHGVKEHLRTDAPKNGQSNIDDVANDAFAQVMKKYK